MEHFRAFGVTNLNFSAWCKTWWSCHGFNVCSSLPKKTLDTSLTLVIFCGHHKNMSHKTDDPLVSEDFQIFTVLKSFSEHVFMLLWSYQKQAILLNAFLRMLEYIFCSNFHRCYSKIFHLSFKNLVELATTPHDRIYLGYKWTYESGSQNKYESVLLDKFHTRLLLSQLCPFLIMML